MIRRFLIVPLLVGLVCGLTGFGTAHFLADRGTPVVATGNGPASQSPSSSRSSSASPSPTTDATAAAALAAYQRLTPAQRVGQLFMIGVTADAPTSEQTGLLAKSFGGNVFLRGHSDLGVDATAAITADLRSVTTFAGVAPFVSADQEGGEAQALTGTGFDTMPTAVTQGTLDPATLRADARSWAGQLKAAGVTLNLAPVGDVVPADVGSANQPIGRYRRQYGDDPTTVGAATAAYVRGMRAGGVPTALKHFPGLGRATGNTDDDPTATDPTTRGDPYLAAYSPAIRAQVPFVMVSSANYPAIDQSNRACFSRVVIGTMLRAGLGFGGVVISDSFGSASLASTPAGERAVKFLRAGGTMVLDTNWLDLAPMTRAVLDESASDPTFAATVRSAVLLVLQAKVRSGLVSAG